MSKAKFINAIGTPLTADEELHDEGLEIQLADLWNHGIDGILVAGSMGAMQLLTDDTYRRLIERSVELSTGKGEVLIGAGDAGFARSRDRIKFINQFKVDGVAVLAPYFWNFSQAELINYYKALADVSNAPIYLYDLPVVTGTKLEIKTVQELSKHPNIAGVKASCNFDDTRQLIDVIDDSFRVIVAQPNLIDVLLHHGVNEHLDGVWGIMPKWTVALGQCAEKGDWEGAAKYQRMITAGRDLIVKYDFAAFTVMMNARGIPGKFAPSPFAPLNDAQNEELLNTPIMKQLIEEDPAQV